MQVDFLEPGSCGEARSYGSGGGRVYVSGAARSAADAKSALLIRKEDARAVILTDGDDMQPVLSEFDLISRHAGSGRFSLYLLFNDAASFRAGFEQELEAQVAGNTRQPRSRFDGAFPNLCADIARSWASLSALFNPASPVSLIVRGIVPGDPERKWHPDVNAYPDGRRFDNDFVAVRCPSPYGSLIAEKDVPKDEKGKYPVERCAHAGQGLYIVAGSTIHAAPDRPDPRYIYKLSPARRLNLGV